MILVDKNTLEVIKDNNRQFKASVVFSFLSVKSPTAIKIKAPNAQNGSTVDKIVYPYLSHIKNRFFVDDVFNAQVKKIPDLTDEHNRVFPDIFNRYANKGFVQVEKTECSHVGYIGAMADTDGNVNDTITLWLPLTDIETVTLRTNPDRIIQDAEIKIYANNQTSKPAVVYKLKNNKSSMLVLPLGCKSVSHLQLSVTKATPNKRLWIVSFFAGLEYAIKENRIIKIKYQQKKSENKEGSIGRLYFNTIDLTLSNLDRIFDKENEKSKIVKYLNTTTTFSVTLSMLQGKMQKPFFLELGTFTVTNFTSKLSDAKAVIKGADFINNQKEKVLNLGIIENKTAYEVFKTIALKLELEPTGIDSALKNITYSLLPLNGTAGKILNQLCSNTNVFCTTRGNVFVATLLKNKHATLRYPQRYFRLDEFKETGGTKQTSVIPNVINLSYAEYEYENGIFVKKKIVLFYNKEIKRQEKKWETVPLQDYINKIYLPEKNKPVSFEATFSSSDLPENFHHIEISDEFLYKCFEYKIDIEKDEQGKVKKARVKIWNYEDREDTEQCTIMFCVKEKPKPEIINSQDFTVYEHSEYKRDKHKSNGYKNDAPKDPNNAEEIEARNAPNLPEVFTIETSGDIQVDKIEIGNYFIPGFFEFYFTRTEKGAEVKVWNYGNVRQVLTVNVYGNRLKKSEQKITVQARNESNIRINGEVVKNVNVDGISSKESAMEILETSMNYYKYFIGELSMQTWSDPRIQLYDFLGFKKLRYPNYSQGIVDEITLEYAGYLTQKIKLQETEKHNRDCRVFEWNTVADRPLQEDNQTTWV
ncbi:MAG: hypothetical protein P1P59_09575 [Treponemataceae bacterium]